MDITRKTLISFLMGKLTTIELVKWTVVVKSSVEISQVKQSMKYI